MTDTPCTSSPRISRASLKDRKTAPVRTIHLDMGASHGADQAWQTAHAEEAADWWVAALRSPTELVDPSLAGWLIDGISVVSTSVDRITLRAGEADKSAVLPATDWHGGHRWWANPCFRGRGLDPRFDRTWPSCPSQSVQSPPHQSPSPHSTLIPTGTNSSARRPTKQYPHLAS